MQTLERAYLITLVDIADLHDSHKSKQILWGKSAENDDEFVCSTVHSSDLSTNTFSTESGSVNCQKSPTLITLPPQAINQLQRGIEPFILAQYTYKNCFY